MDEHYKLAFVLTSTSHIIYDSSKVPLSVIWKFNPFPSKGFPMAEQNRLALDRVRSISALRAHSAVEGLMGTQFLTLLITEETCFLIDS